MLHLVSLCRFVPTDRSCFPPPRFDFEGVTELQGCWISSGTGTRALVRGHEASLGDGRRWVVSDAELEGKSVVLAHDVIHPARILKGRVVRSSLLRILWENGDIWVHADSPVILQLERIRAKRMAEEWALKWPFFTVRQAVNSLKEQERVYLQAIAAQAAPLGPVFARWEGQKAPGTAPFVPFGQVCEALEAMRVHHAWDTGTA